MDADFDVYSLPEWQRTEMSSRALGNEPIEMSMDQFAKDNPNWYDIPYWMRTDILKARGFGYQEPQPERARRAMLSDQSRKG